MRRFKATTPAKILLMTLAAGIAVGGAYAGVKSGVIKMDKEPSKQETSVNKPANKPDAPQKDTSDKNHNVINLSLDEWIG